MQDREFERDIYKYNRINNVYNKVHIAQNQFPGLNLELITQLRDFKQGTYNCSWIQLVQNIFTTQNQLRETTGKITAEMHANIKQCKDNLGLLRNKIDTWYNQFDSHSSDDPRIEKHINSQFAKIIADFVKILYEFHAISLQRVDAFNFYRISDCEQNYQSIIIRNEFISKVIKELDSVAKNIEDYLKHTENLKEEEFEKRYNKFLLNDVQLILKQIIVDCQVVNLRLQQIDNFQLLEEQEQRLIQIQQQLRNNAIDIRNL